MGGLILDVAFGIGGSSSLGRAPTKLPQISPKQKRPAR